MNSMDKTEEHASGGIFVPLQMRTGMSALDFMSARTGRDVIVWGAGMLGRCLIRQLAPHAAPGQKLSFTDASPRLVGTMIDDRYVLTLDEAIQRTREGSTFLLVALAGHTKTAMGRLAEAGLATGTDYEAYLKLSRPEAVIQVSSRTDGCLVNMAVMTYQSVLAKLKIDIPDLFHIDLSGWGDPLDHPDIADIVEVTHSIAPCTITTRLDVSWTAIERALLAAPTQFVVSVDGPRDHSFFECLRGISDLQEQLAGRTEIRVKYLRYRDNNEGFEALRASCIELGLRIVVAIGYIDPYDTTLALCESGNLDSTESSRLAWPLRVALDLARADRTRPCLCQRIFPVIDTGGSVGVCHLYARPRLHDNYLAVNYNILQQLRLNAAHCRVCQRYALHRLDIDVLQTRHAIQLIPAPETAHA